ncbi:ankyrin-3-like [Phymastichus coffea]|uniref:ankyrin-3-like n=1 Tax=Phymastichus coffea TaxID=108790 RepID=UPI00273AF4EA|nr:ankyrin-3-like [Phymastichus coffea]
MAIKTTSRELFETILNKEGLPSSENNADYKVLKKALMYGCPDIAGILLDRGCRANNQLLNDNSPLHLAVSRRNCIKLVRQLIDCGARVDQKNRKDETPLHVAFDLAEGKVVDLLLEHHLRNRLTNESNRIGMTYLHIAASRKKLDNVRRLVEDGKALVNCQVDKKSASPYAGFTPLHMAVEFNNQKVAKLLLRNGADLWACDSRGSTPLHLALERKNVKMVECLFKYDFKRENYVNGCSLSHFMAACIIGDPTVVADYLMNPVNSKTALINERVSEFSDMSYPFKNYTPLHFAAEYGRQDIVRLLINNGAHCRKNKRNGVMLEHLADVDGYHKAADLFVTRCLQHSWSLDISSLKITEDEKLEDIMMVCDDDDESGYFDDSSSNTSVSYDDTDENRMSYVTDDSAFWEDDITDYIL